MNSPKVIRQLNKHYPHKNIVMNDDSNPSEIICELGVQEDGSGLAIAVIDSSLPHYHNQTTEVYEIINGELDVFISNRKVHLIAGERIQINPKEVHYAIGKETWVKVKSNPPWDITDHFITVNE